MISFLAQLFKGLKLKNTVKLHWTLWAEMPQDSALSTRFCVCGALCILQVGGLAYWYSVQAAGLEKGKGCL